MIGLIKCFYKIWFTLKLKLTGGFYILDMFAAEDEGKTELPTERKKRRAREEEGRVVNSGEINQTVVLAIAISVISLFMLFYIDVLKRFMVQLFSMLSNTEDIGVVENIYQLSIDSLIVILKIAGPVFLAALFIGVASNVAQTQFLFTTKNIKVDMKRIAPTWKNFKDRVLFSPQNLMNMVKVLFKIIILMMITTFTIKSYYPKILMMGTYSLSSAASLFLSIVVEMFFKVIAFMAIVAAIDYFFQKRQYTNTLKMTKFEMKQEFKETEGDPLVKARLQEMSRRIVNRSMLKAVPDADVIITNPTHFAIALKYQEGAMQAPTVIAKGTDNVALKIKSIAIENGVEIVENKPLARELYYNVEVGDYIPERMFYVISRILAAVYRMRRMKFRNGRSA